MVISRPVSPAEETGAASGGSQSNSNAERVQFPTHSGDAPKSMPGSSSATFATFKGKGRQMEDPVQQQQQQQQQQHSPGHSTQHQRRLTFDESLDGILFESPSSSRRTRRLDSGGLSSPEDTFSTSPVVTRDGIAITGKGKRPQLARDDMSMADRYARRASSAAFSTHSRTTSSVGTPLDFEGFSPYSFASTAPTSLSSSCSPDEPKGNTLGSPFRETDDHSQTSAPPSTSDTFLREPATTLEPGVDSSAEPCMPSRPWPQRQYAWPTDGAADVPGTAQWNEPLQASQVSGLRGADTSTQVSPEQQCQRTQSAEARGNNERPPAYESRVHLPDYNESDGVDSNTHERLSASHRLRRNMASRAASSRIIPRRVATSLSLANSGTTRPTRPAQLSRGSRSRSDSAPELANRPGRSRPMSRRAPRDWAATQYISGARMGPLPHLSSAHYRAPPGGEARRSVPSLLSGLRDRARSSRQVPTTHSVPSSSRNSCFELTSAQTARENNDRPSHGLGTASPSPGSRGSPVATGHSTPHSGLRHQLSLFHKGDSGFKASLSEALSRARRDVNGSPAVETPFSPDSEPNTHFQTIQQTSSEAPQQLTTELDSRAVTQSKDVRPPALLRAALHAPTAPATVVSTSASAAREGHSWVSDAFNVRLPRELRIKILRELVLSHVDDHIEDVAQGRYRGSVSREATAVGRQKAVRELVQLSRVSKGFASLVLDGQLWRTLDFSALPGLTRPAMLTIVRSTGPFVQNLDLSGLPCISSHVLNDFTDALIAGNSHSETSLTELDLSGLPQLSTKSVHRLLAQSPSLAKANLSDLPCVCDDTMSIITQSCPSLKELNISRCHDVYSNGIRRWLNGASASALAKVVVLRMAGLRNVSTVFMQTLAQRLPNLEVLDLSYASGLSDEAVAAWTFHDGPDDPNGEAEAERPYIEITARQASVCGVNTVNASFASRSDDRHFRAVQPHLKQLILSSTGVTDRACAALAFGALPKLQVLELANNPRVRDAGLCALLESSPQLRRLDLEGARDISNAVVYSLTPWQDESSAGNARRLAQGAIKAPGAELTHLILSQASRIETAPLQALIHACPHLCHLEVDDTRINDSLATLFVDVMKKRRAAGALAGSDKTSASDAYVSLIDCRQLTRHGCNSMLSTGTVRPRVGHRSPIYNGFEYGDLDEAQPLSTNLSASDQMRAMLDDECNSERVCVKTFWYWSALDRKEREARKAEVKRKKKNSTLSSLGLMSRVVGDYEGGATGRDVRGSDQGGRRRQVGPQTQRQRPRSAYAGGVSTNAAVLAANDGAGTDLGDAPSNGGSTTTPRWLRFTRGIFSSNDASGSGSGGRAEAGDGAVQAQGTGANNHGHRADDDDDDSDDDDDDEVGNHGEGDDDNNNNDDDDDDDDSDTDDVVGRGVCSIM
ncbi:unnamed protein product [Jaminaea pallidilutea]